MVQRGICLLRKTVLAFCLLVSARAYLPTPTSQSSSPFHDLLTRVTSLHATTQLIHKPTTVDLHLDLFDSFLKQDASKKSAHSAKFVPRLTKSAKTADEPTIETSIVKDAHKQLKQGAVEGLTDEIIKTCINHFIPGCHYAYMMRTVISDLVTTSILKEAPTVKPATKIALSAENDSKWSRPSKPITKGFLPTSTLRPSEDTEIDPPETRSMASVTQVTSRTDLATPVKPRNIDVASSVGQPFNRCVNGHQERCMTISLTVPPPTLGPFMIMTRPMEPLDCSMENTFEVVRDCSCDECVCSALIDEAEKAACLQASATRRLHIQAMTSIARFFVVPLVCHSLAHALPSSSIHMAFEQWWLEHGSNAAMELAEAPSEF
jgi:hypothetical protein